MAEQTLKASITDAMKTAMRNKDKDRLGTIRMMQAAIKQIEIDERRELDDSEVLAVLDKMLKQRRDATAQYEDAGRDDLADREKAEMVIIEEFLPAALTEDEIDGLVRDAISKSDANGMQDMGKVMGLLKPQLQGRADMGAVSKKVRAALS
ncbi:GatB/YqeY domain-containing protein [Marinobacteraceae bacterium S3BR75-40.1]